ncbi:MAG TPA: peptidylprolyl isomerase [Planctomycetota bacterium]|nr:peptidylprolyl isomerase [Planctomycetota bacterium]
MRGAAFLPVLVLYAASTLAQEPQPKLAPQSIVMRTAAGDLVIRLYPEVAPLHTEQFLKLARLGVFNGIHFYRIHPGFLIQAGVAEDRLAPLTPEQTAAIKTIKAEWSSIKHRKGVLNLGRADNDPDSGATAFSIMLGDAPHLDGLYTIFGRVDDKSFEVLDQLARVPCEGTTPKTRITVEEAFVLEDEKALRSFQRAPVRNIADEIRLQQTRLPVPLPVFRLIALLTVAGLTLYLLGKRASNWTICACVLVQAGLAGWVMWALHQASAASGGSTDEKMPAAGAIFGLMIPVAAIAALSLVGTRWLSLRIRMSLNLLNVLMGGFALILIAVPMAQISTAAGVAMFVGLVSVIKLMGSFESYS